MAWIDSIARLLAEHVFLSLLASATAYFVVVIVFRTYFHPLARYPGPLLGRFTDFHSYFAVFQQNRTAKQYELLQKYGSPVRVSTNELVFSDLKTVSEIYGQSSLTCPKDPFITEALSATGAANVLSIVDRGLHGRVRRLLSHGFSLKSLLESEGLIAAKVEEYINVVFRGKEGQILNIYKYNHELYLDIISQLAFGKSFDCLSGQNTSASHDVEQFGKVIPPQAFFPWLRYLPSEYIREGFRAVARLETFARICVDDYVRGMQSPAPAQEKTKSLLRNIVEVQDAETGTSLSTEEIVENAIIFLIAGSGTTAVAVTYLIWECGRRPEVMAKLTEEIRGKFPSADMIPTYEEASRLRYLNNVVNETLRLWGPLNTGVPRLSPGKIIGGHYIPTGVGISNNPYATARDPVTFPNPDQFDPSRWDFATSEMRIMSRPFSLGPRNCIGRHVAEIGLYLTVTRLFQLFDVTTDSSMTEDKMKLRDQGAYTPWDESLLVTATSAFEH